MVGRDIFESKPPNVVKDIKTCKLAYYEPASEIEGVISDMYFSLATIPETSQPVLHVHIVFRKIYEDHREKYSGNKSRGCLNCKRRDDWLINHTNKARLVALRKNQSFRHFATSVLDGGGKYEK